MSIDLVMPPGPVSKTVSLFERYLRGRQCLPERGNGKWIGPVSFAKGKPARLVARSIARQLAVPEDEVVRDAKFAVAVDSIIRNCGESASAAIFSVELPQTRRAVERIARTSDTRQRYRVDGILTGRFQSLAPQNNDSVFDTVKFTEVNSRLARAAGQLRKWAASHQIMHGAGATEAAKLAHLCHVAATTLRAFLATKRRTAFQVPVSIERDAIEAVFESTSVCGNTVGPLKGSLKLIVKNVWDFDEMARRGIAGMVGQNRGARAAIEEIVASVNCIQTRCGR